MEKAKSIADICDRQGIRLIDAALRFPLLHPVVVSVIPGTQRMEELDSTIRAAQAVIPPALWADLKSAGLLRPDAPTGGAA
jgi:D-threo-aldose 1-dehydrogenase